MSVDTQAFQRFQDMLNELGEYAAMEPLPEKEAVAQAKAAFARNLNGRKALDLETCIQCGMCAEVCHFYEATGEGRYAPVYKFRLLRRFYRREMSPMRWLWRWFTPDITAKDLDKWQELVYDACTSCGRCDVMCPMGVNISRLINVVRQGMAAAGYLPTEFRELHKQLAEQGSVFGVDRAKVHAVIGKLKADGIEIPVDKEQADVMLLTSANEILLFPDTFAGNAKLLNKSGVNWTMRSESFLGTNLGIITGNEKVFRMAAKRVVDAARACGAKTVIAPESGSAYEALRWETAEEVGIELPFDVLSMPEFAWQKVKSGELKPNEAAKNGRTATYHDPCRLGRYGGVMSEPRELLEAVGFELRETDATRRQNYCCGGGCGDFVNKRSAKLRQQAFEIKRGELQEAGGDEVVTACTSCRINLMLGAQHTGWHKPVTSLAETLAERLD